MGQQVINDLKMTLNAIKVRREAYQLLVDIRLNEAVEEFPNVPQSELYKRVITSAEAREAFQELLNLYGCVGASSDQYLTALNSVGA